MLNQIDIFVKSENEKWSETIHDWKEVTAIGKLTVSEENGESQASSNR